MSQNIKNKLIAIENKLALTTAGYNSATNCLNKNIQASKRAIKEALEFNGLRNVPEPTSDEATFQRYAELIRRLKAGNAMILQVTIPETAITNYKRSVILPMQFSSANHNHPASRVINGVNVSNAYDLIADEIISAQKAATPEIASLDEEIPAENGAETDGQNNGLGEHERLDSYNNIVSDEYIDITMEDIMHFLDEEEVEEFTQSAKRMGVRLRSVAASNDSGISGLAVSDNWEPDTNATYSFIVNWGDGTEAVFDSKGDYESNKAAIWHTYNTPGNFEITITGVFKWLYSNTTSFLNWVNYQDVDGTYITGNLNYGMRYSLTQVTAWGNTLLNNMANAFCYCQALTTIPARDTSNSFADVTNFSYAFYQCISLSELPYNAAIDKGLFSGCEKATTFAYTFAYCSGIKSSIPVKLIDGCPNVTSTAGMFCYAGFTGDIPMGMLAGMTALTNPSEMFANCALTGQLSDDLFKDCPNITTIYRLFYGCSKVTGIIGYDFISNKSKLTDMRQAFCSSGISGFAENAFEGITSDGINCREAFALCPNLTSIPAGVIENLTGKNLMLERMFADDTKLTTISTNALKNLKVSNARGMFDGCTSMNCACPTANDDWNTYEGMKRWYSTFANTKLSDIATVALELGGDGDRKFTEGKVGAILLADGSLVDPKDYTYSADNQPVAVIHSDVYIDSEFKATLGNGVGNIVPSSAANKKHVLFASVFNDTLKAWTNGQVNAVDIPGITNTSDISVSYNDYNWNDERTVAILRSTRYNGIAYTKAINDWRVSKGMATKSTKNDVDVYTKTDTDKYDAVDYCMDWNWVTNTKHSGLPEKLRKNSTPILSDASELWDQFVQRGLIEKAYAKIRPNVSCIQFRTGAWYWTSGEYSSASAWGCSTSYAGIYYNFPQWNTFYVRPALAFYVDDANATV